MDSAITGRPSYAQLGLILDPGESERAEARAMVSYSGDIGVQTGAAAS